MSLISFELFIASLVSITISKFDKGSFDFEKGLISSLFFFKRTFKILMSFSTMKSKVFAVSKVISASAILPSYVKQYNFFLRLVRR